MSIDATVVYYTSNRESPEFEKKIQRTLLENMGDLPLISVSQKPMDFGHNICVGDVGISGHNAFRQFQIGTLEAKTRYILPAESDMLYPPEYFQFEPPTNDRIYVAYPLYVAFMQRRKPKYYGYKPRGSESAMVVDRDFLLRRFDVMFQKLDTWGPIEEEIFLLRRQPWEKWVLQAPVITFKTDANMHRKTPHDIDHPVYDVPYWGNVRELIGRYR